MTVKQKYILQSVFGLILLVVFGSVTVFYIRNEQRISKQEGDARLGDSQVAFCGEPAWTEDEIKDQFYGFATIGTFDNPQYPTSVMEGGRSPLLVKFERTQDKTKVNITVQNESEKCLTTSVGVYKMYDGNIENQKYYTGQDNIHIDAASSKTVTFDLPSCMSQIDLYGTSTAPRQLQASYGYGEGPPLMGAAFHLNQNTTFSFPIGPLCTDTTPPPPVEEEVVLECTPQTQTLALNTPMTFAVNVLKGTGDRDLFWAAPGSTNPEQSGKNLKSFTTSYTSAGDYKVSVSSMYPGNDISYCSVKVEQAPPPPPPPVAKVCKLAIDKQVNKSTATPGETLEYTINFKNEGDGDCTGGVKVEDALDSRLSFISQSSSSNITSGYGALPGYSNSVHTVYWDAGTLTPGETGWVKFQAKLSSDFACGTSNVPNKSRITSKEYSSFTQYVNSNEVKTAVTKTCTEEPPPPPPPTPPQPPLPPAPPELVCTPASQIVSTGQNTIFTASGGTGSYSWVVSNGKTGTGSSFSTTFTAPGLYEAKVTSGSQTKICTAEARTPIPTSSDLSLTKSVDKPKVTVGDLVTFTVTVTNDGPIATTGVTVKDVLPDGLVYQSSTPLGVYNQGTGIWNIGSLAVGQTASIDFTVKASKVGKFVNTAEVASSQYPDIDSTPLNGVASEDDIGSSEVVVVEGLVPAGLNLSPYVLAGLLAILFALLMRFGFTGGMKASAISGGVKVESKTDYE